MFTCSKRPHWAEPTRSEAASATSCWARWIISWLTLPRERFAGMSAVLETRQPFVAPLAAGQKAGIMKLTRENIPVAGGDRASAFVARFSAGGKLEGIYELPLSQSVALSRRFVTVSETGDVYFLRTRQASVDVLGVGFAAPGAGRRGESGHGLAGMSENGDGRPAAPGRVRKRPLRAPRRAESVPGVVDRSARSAVCARQCVAAAGGLHSFKGL